MEKSLCVIAAHPSSDLHIKSTVSNIKYFLEICDKIVIVGSKEFKKSDPLKDAITKTYPDTEIEYHYFANTANLCHGKWTNYIDNIYEFDHENILLTNDSFLAIKSLLPLKDMHLSEQNEMTGLVSSREGMWHCQDFIRFYNNDHIKKLIRFYKECNAKHSHFKLVSELDRKRMQQHYDFCVEAERFSCQLFSKQGCLFTLPLSYKKNLNFDNEMLELYIKEKDYPVVKIRKIKYTYYQEDFSEKLPEDFDPEEYKLVNMDLELFSQQMLADHFMKHGSREGRLYKKDQKIILPNFIKSAISKEISYYE